MWRGLLVAAVLVCASAAVEAAPVQVGSGPDKADVVIRFSDQAWYFFEVSFTEPVSGLGLLDIIEAETTLTTVRNDFGFGVFVDGITYDGHSDVGYGGGENWWHYWTWDAGQTSPSAPVVGAADRMVYDGGGDGWGYGTAAAIPEPAAAGLLGVGSLVLFRRR